MTTPDTSDCGADIAAYALGVLEPDEAVAVRAHLETCAVCRDELSAFGAVVDALPLGVPQQAPPRSLKRRVMAAVQAEAREAAPARPRARPSRWSLMPRPLLGAAATALAAVAVLIGVSLGGSQTPTRVVHASTSWPGSSASLRIGSSSADLVVARMPAPPPGNVYEVWTKRAGAPPMPTNALFSVTSGGAADVAVPGNLHGVSQVMVTPEPAGGSRLPTHAPVLVANL